MIVRDEELVGWPPERIHFSRLKGMSLSPAHFRAGYLPQDDDTPARRFGSAVHVLALGGEVVRFEGERKGNAWAAFKGLVAGEEHFTFDGAHRGKAWAAAKEEAAGRLIVSTEDLEAAREAVELQSRRRAAGRYLAPVVTPVEYERAQRCADAVRANGEAVALLNGPTEVPLRWRFLDRDCGGQLDAMPRRIVSDLKTVTCADPDWFPRHALKMYYHVQLEWYRVGAVENGHPVDECALVAVETKPPFAVTCFVLTARVLEVARRQLRLWMERLLACESDGSWPEYVQSRVELDLPDEDLVLDFTDYAA